jgi:hypothetical protein
MMTISLIIPYQGTISPFQDRFKLFFTLLQDQTNTSLTNNGTLIRHNKAR